MPTIAYPHIEIKNGVPTIDGTRLKVMHLVIDQRSGLTPEQMLEAHPFLTLAQIHSALAYYYDNREEIDQEIARRQTLDKQIAREAEKSPLQQKVRDFMNRQSP